MTAATVQTPDGLNEECNLLYVTLYGTDMVRVSSCCALKHARYVFIDRRPTPSPPFSSLLRGGGGGGGGGGSGGSPPPRAHVRSVLRSVRQPFPG